MDYIEKIRSERKKTIKELCNFVGVDKSTYSRWVRGERNPNLKNVYSLCKFLDLDFKETVEKYFL
ncbi:MAG: helix-turn-helix domain-containing protein [Peptostreptococcaceae bacterium]